MRPLWESSAPFLSRGEERVRCPSVPLSEELRHELAHTLVRRDCDRLAELSALFHTAGSAHLEGRGRISVHLDLSSSAIARRAFVHLRAFGVDSEIRTYRQRAFAKTTRYQLYIAGTPRALQFLNEAGVIDVGLAPIDYPPRRVVARSCCRASYLRGALLGAGSLSGPSALHLEIRTAGSDGAAFLVDVAAREGIDLHLGEREQHAYAYAKAAEPIEDLLALCGASETVLLLAERSVIGQARSEANRLANADHANIVRASNAARVQLGATRRLEARGALAHLSVALQEAAQLRRDNPALSVAELAREARVAKPTLYGRLRKLIELAERIP